MEPEDDWVGGGSGGDAGLTSKGHVTKSAEGIYQIGANQVVLVSRERADVTPSGATPPPAVKLTNGNSKIILLAAGTSTGKFIDDGGVDIRGCKGVRITSGPGVIPDPTSVPTVSDPSTNGVEIFTAEPHSIKLHRGIKPSVDQRIEMTPGPPNGAILVDGGAGTITVQADLDISVTSKKSITLTVGASSITMTPSSITIKSTSVTVEAPKVTVTADSSCSINGGMNMTLAAGKIAIN